MTDSYYDRAAQTLLEASVVCQDVLANSDNYRQGNPSFLTYTALNEMACDWNKIKSHRPYVRWYALVQDYLLLAQNRIATVSYGKRGNLRDRLDDVRDKAYLLMAELI